MSLYLCGDEKVLKSWTFASDDTSAGKKNYNLTVTNKRIISTNEAPHSITRTELPLNSVKGITGSYSASKQEQANPKKALVILGLILVLVGILLVAVLYAELFAIIIGALMALGGLILAVYGGSQSTTVTTYAGFKLNITTYGQETSSMAVGKQFSANAAQTQTISVTHITINETAAREIIDMLGALVIGKSELNSSQPPQAEEGLYDEVAAADADENVLTKEN